MLSKQKLFDLSKFGARENFWKKKRIKNKTLEFVSILHNHSHHHPLTTAQID